MVRKRRTEAVSRRMFLDFYKIREQPFGETPDPRYLYLSPTHREAIASLAYGLDARKGFLALVAEPGMGKTTLVFHLLEWLRESARTVFLFQTQCSSHGLLSNLLTDLEVDVQGKGLAWMHERLKEVLINEASVGRRLVVFIDEAQNLSESVLETVRLLSDFENPRSKLIQIVLIGQPELADKLARPAMAQLRQRISILARLSPLISTEAEAYINHRLAVAGSVDQQLFTPQARGMIANWSSGIPRNINTLCFGALSLGYAMSKHKIDGSVIREAITDLDVNPRVTAPNDSRQPGEVFAVPNASPPEASKRSEPEQSSHQQFEPVVMPIARPGNDASSVLTFEARPSRRTVALATIALLAFSVVGAFGISLSHVLTRPAAESRATANPTIKQAQNSISGARPLHSRSGRHEKKPAVDVLDAGLLGTQLPVSTWESMQEILVENPSVLEMSSSSPEGIAPARVASAVKEPVLVARIGAAYPAEAMQSGIEGEVIIDTVIDATGKPTTLWVVSGPSMLRPAAVNAVRKWQYRPDYLGDQAAPIEIRIAVEFRLVN